MGLAESVDEVEPWPKDGKDHDLLGVMVGQGVSHCVCVPSLYLMEKSKPLCEVKQGEDGRSP